MDSSKSINNGNSITIQSFKMKNIIFILLLLPVLTMAETAVGVRCYSVEPALAPGDNATERMFVVERGDPGSGVFDSVGVHEDLQGIRTPIHATSRKLHDPITGAVSYSRAAYVVLGNIAEELELAQSLDVEGMFNLSHKFCVVVSYSSLYDVGSGSVSGSFRADAFCHDSDTVALGPSAFNTGPGLIYSVPCQ
jgi:hypothetical protein